ncbi:MAG: chaperone NapD [Myxococcales bacterium]|nr:chaperone NapD [Myxococcales bacterium]
MPITGAVILLPTEEPARRALFERLERDPRVELGIEAAGRLALVVETETTRECTNLFDELSALEGVGAVLPVFHDFSDFHDARDAQAGPSDARSER